MRLLILFFYGLILFLKEIPDNKMNNPRNEYLLEEKDEVNFLILKLILLIIRRHILRLLIRKNYFVYDLIPSKIGLIY